MSIFRDKHILESTCLGQTRFGMKVFGTNISEKPKFKRMRTGGGEEEGWRRKGRRRRKSKRNGVEGGGGGA